MSSLYWTHLFNMPRCPKMSRGGTVLSTYSFSGNYASAVTWCVQRYPLLTLAFVGNNSYKLQQFYIQNDESKFVSICYSRPSPLERSDMMRKNKRMVFTSRCQNEVYILFYCSFVDNCKHDSHFPSVFLIQ